MVTVPSGSTDEGGFALLFGLVALVALTALATGGIYVASSDFQSTTAFEEGHRAFYAADAGLQEFIGTHGADPPSTVRYDFGNGEKATVTAVRVRRDPDVYRIESTGVVVVNGDTVATRTVGKAAKVYMGPFPEPSAALFAPNGVEKNGDQGVVSGYDQFDPDNPGQCPDGQVEDKDGVVVSDSAGYTQDGDSLVAEGSPNDTLSRDLQTMLDEMDTNWKDVISGDSLNPDVTVDPNSMASWPDFDTIPAGTWPVIYATGKDKTLDLDKNHSGQGLLVTRGDLQFSGDFSWKGMVAVGGELTASKGGQTVDGAFLTGLNRLLGEDPGGVTYLNGEKYFRYHSCYVYQSRRASSMLKPVPGSWYQGERSS